MQVQEDALCSNITALPGCSVQRRATAGIIGGQLCGHQSRPVKPPAHSSDSTELLLKLSWESSDTLFSSTACEAKDTSRRKFLFVSLHFLPLVSKTVLRNSATYLCLFGASGSPGSYDAHHVQTKGTAQPLAVKHSST